MSIDRKALDTLAETEHWLQIAVAAAVVARMEPNYRLFCEVSDFDGAAVFSNVLGLVWEFAAGTNSAIDFDKQQAKLEAITPDPADFDMYGVWPALDATVALAALLSCCDQFDTAEIDSIFDVSRATITGFLEASGDLAPDHQLYRLEDDYLSAVLEAAEVGAAAPAPQKQRVAKIRTVVRGIEASNIGLSLD